MGQTKGVSFLSVYADKKKRDTYQLIMSLTTFKSYSTIYLLWFCKYSFVDRFI
jgi:hypothetical protein